MTIKGKGLDAGQKSIGNNLTGQCAHPGNPKIVKNDPTLNKGTSADGFAGNQSKPKVSIK